MRIVNLVKLHRAVPLSVLLWAACVPGGSPPEGTVMPAATSARGIDPALRLLPHVEVAAEGVIDWGNLRLTVRVRVPAGEEEEGPVRAEAERRASVLASCVRVDTRNTLADLVGDAAALRRWTVASLRSAGRRRLSTGELEETYEVPFTGEGGFIDHLCERASRTADSPYVPDVPYGPCGPVIAFGGNALPPGRSSCLPEPVPSVMRALSAAAGGSSATARTLTFFKGLVAAGSSRRGALAPVIIIDARRTDARGTDARGTGLAPALFPTILSEDGRPVYKVAAASGPDQAAARREFVVREGFVQYVELERGADLADLARLPRLRRQVVVRARAAEGPLRASIVLDAEDARRLRAEAAALEEARVVVVMDAR